MIKPNVNLELVWSRLNFLVSLNRIFFWLFFLLFVNKWILLIFESLFLCLINCYCSLMSLALFLQWLIVCSGYLLINVKHFTLSATSKPCPFYLSNVEILLTLSEDLLTSLSFFCLLPVLLNIDPIFWNSFLQLPPLPPHPLLVF